MDEEKLWNAFHFFDKESKGVITLENLKEAFRKAGKYLSEKEI